MKLRGISFLGALVPVLLVFAAPYAQAAALTSITSQTPLSGSDLRAALIEAYIGNVLACTQNPSTPCANRLSAQTSNESANVSCADATHCQFEGISLSPEQAEVAAEAPAMGNDLFKHLGTLFVLDNLFRHESDGLLSPDGTSLGDLLVLYQLFFAASNSAPNDIGLP